MQVCAFFFFLNKKEKKRFVPPSPALRPVPQGQIISSRRRCSPAPERGTSRALLGHSPARTVGTELPPLCHPDAALPSPAIGRGPCQGRPRRPASRALSCFWNAGAKGRASWGISAPARAWSPPRLASLAVWPGSGERDTAVSQPRAHRARPTHRPRARRAAAASRARRRARATPCPGWGARGVRPGSLGRLGTKGPRGASGLGAPWLTGKVPARAARRGQDPRWSAVTRVPPRSYSSSVGPGPAPVLGTALPSGERSARLSAARGDRAGPDGGSAAPSLPARGPL